MGSCGINLSHERSPLSLVKRMLNCTAGFTAAARDSLAVIITFLYGGSGALRHFSICCFNPVISEVLVTYAWAETDFGSSLKADAPSAVSRESTRNPFEYPEEHRARSASKLELQQNQIRSLLCDEPENAISPVTGDDLIPFFNQFLLVKQSDGRIGVNNKNAFHFSCLPPIGDDIAGA